MITLYNGLTSFMKEINDFKECTIHLKLTKDMNDPFDYIRNKQRTCNNFNFSIFFSASALKCWRCSSDSQNGAFCTDPFDQTLVSEQNRRWSYIDCSLPTNHLQPFNPTNTRPVCKKIKQLGK